MLIGVFGGLLAAEVLETIMPILMGLAAGSFLVVVGYDLIPHSVRNSRTSGKLQHIGWFIAGLAIMLAVMLLIGESY